MSPHAHLPLVIARLWVHRIFTSEGRIRIGNNVLELWKANKESRSREMLNHPFPQRNVARAARVAIIERMVAHLRGEEDNISNGADGRAAMEIALAFYESHDTGGWVKLPLTDRSRQVKVLHGPSSLSDLTHRHF